MPTNVQGGKALIIANNPYLTEDNWMVGYDYLEKKGFIKPTNQMSRVEQDKYYSS